MSSRSPAPTWSAGTSARPPPKTDAVIERAREGVLFIDEAYSLARGEPDGRDFGHEAIDTLVQAMENLRGKLVVIAAGYPGRWSSSCASNPGLPSRFTERVVFPDYSGSELARSCGALRRREAYELPTDALDRVGALVRAASGAGSRIRSATRAPHAGCSSEWRPAWPGGSAASRMARRA